MSPTKKKGRRKKEEKKKKKYPNGFVNFFFWGGIATVRL
jgi:hypothetical protein